MCFQRKGAAPVSERSTTKKASGRAVSERSQPGGDSEPSAKQTFKKEQGVYVLTEKDFDTFVDTHPTFLAEFYAPTCIHCQALAPNYAKAATLVSIPLAKIDGSVEKNLMKRFDISVYPTMKFWKDGNDPVDYDGGREVNDIVSWIQSHTTTKSQEPVGDEGVVVLTTANFDNFVKGQQLCLVDFYAPWCSHCKKLAPEYEKAASTLKQQGCPAKLAKVDCTVEKELQKRFEIKGYPTLKLFQDGKISDTYDGDREADAIVKYMRGKASKMTGTAKGEAVITLTATSFDDFVNKNDVCLIEFYAPWCSHCKTLAPEYEKAASTLKQQGSPAKLAKVDCTVEKELQKRFEIKGYPTLKLFQDGKISDTYDGDREADAIVKYMRGKASKMTGTAKGEAVITLTATNFDDFVNKNDVCLIEFYAPWCEHCKKLAPEYEKAAKMLRDQNSPIKLGQVDCTVEKDLAKKCEIKKYPTLRVSNRGKISDYEGAREAKSIVNYMLSISNDIHEQQESSEKEEASESLKEKIGLIEEEKAY